ncbi:hypothetical protein TNCT_423741 [Trichonephila clavata]|uniref:Uncharacterized protein n=1 Tax=Trichonephila clavata TaxID=2740835 RepID=A0A8X6G158_TRICU|nr:hypothetical protein TNCT_423741 [Trichonephila clavata]
MLHVVSQRKMSTKSSPPPPKTTTEGSEKPLDLSNTSKVKGFGKNEKRWGFHPYRFQRDDEVVCISRTDKRTEEEYSPASPNYTPCSPNYPPSSPSLPDLPSLNTTPAPTSAPEPSFPTYNLLKTYFSSNFVQYIPQHDFGMGFSQYITYKMGNKKMTYVALNKNNLKKCVGFL